MWGCVGVVSCYLCISTALYILWSNNTVKGSPWYIRNGWRGVKHQLTVGCKKNFWKQSSKFWFIFLMIVGDRKTKEFISQLMCQICIVLLRFCRFVFDLYDTYSTPFIVWILWCAQWTTHLRDNSFHILIMFSSLSDDLWWSPVDDLFFQNLQYYQMLFC